MLSDAPIKMHIIYIKGNNNNNNNTFFLK